jgi:hypothetical protein
LSYQVHRRVVFVDIALPLDDMIESMVCTLDQTLRMILAHVRVFGGTRSATALLKQSGNDAIIVMLRQARFDPLVSYF